MNFPRHGGTDKAKTERQVELGDRVRAAREVLGWLQDDLSLESGVHRTYLASLETGRRDPRLDVVCQLAASLGVNVGHLLERLDTKGSHVVAGTHPSPNEPWGCCG
jgi:transcriptional regulator with XRE-family HTH domain